MNIELIQKTMVSIDLQQRIQLVMNVCLDKARQTFGTDKVPLNIPTVYKTKSVCAGFANMTFSYKFGVKPKMTKCNININPVLLNENIEYVVNQTVPHEVAHVVAYSVFGDAIRKHGVEWIRIMRLFGCKTNTCHDLDISTIVHFHNRKKYSIKCDCGELFKITKMIASKMKKGNIYSHSYCGKSISHLNLIEN